MKRSNRLIIEGPTAYGTFFIRDANNRVWDGRAWRGFGAAEQYDYPTAFQTVLRLKRVNLSKPSHEEQHEEKPQ